MYKFYIELYDKIDGGYILQSKAYDTAESVYNFLKQIEYIEVGISFRYGLSLMLVRVGDEGEYEVVCGEDIEKDISIEELQQLCENLIENN